MPNCRRLEDLLPDDQNPVEINRTDGRKGAVVAFLADARMLSTLPLGSPEREPVIERLRGIAQALREIEPF